VQLPVVFFVDSDSSGGFLHTELWHSLCISLFTKGAETLRETESGEALRIMFGVSSAPFAECVEATRMKSLEMMVAP